MAAVAPVPREPLAPPADEEGAVVKFDADAGLASIPGPVSVLVLMPTPNTAPIASPVRPSVDVIFVMSKNIWC